MSNDAGIAMPGPRTPDGGPPQPWYRRKRYVIPLGIVGGIAVLLVGVAIGAAGKTTAAVETVHQSPAPAPTVTVTVTETATQQARPQPTVTKTVIKYRTGTPGSGGTTVTSRFNGTGTQNTRTALSTSTACRSTSWVRAAAP
jgi:hypothetical protein